MERLSELEISAFRALDRLQRVGESLLSAAEQGHVAEVRRYVAQGGGAWADEDGTTALMVAASMGHEDCVDALLPSANVGAVDSDGLDAARHAIAGGHGSLADKIRAWLAIMSATSV